MSVDPFTLEVIRNALSAMAEEMSLVVMRSARSPVLREAGDLSSALTDAEGNLIAQGKDIPAHMGVMSFTVKDFLKHVSLDRLAPGDVWFLNVPHIGGNHLPDVKAIRPIFYDGELQAFSVSLAHWADVGGGAPGSYFVQAYDAWQEGLRIPPLRVFTGKGVDEEKLDVILYNVRGAEERRGDIYAQMAATRAAEIRMHELIDEHGVDTLREAIAALHDISEKQMREAISKIPNGTYVGEDFMDDDGHGGPPSSVRVVINIADDSAFIDFSESCDQVPGPLNTTHYNCSSGVFYAMKALVGPDIQPNAGCYRPLEIITRKGSIVDPGLDAPLVGGNHETSQRVADAIFRAFESAVPELLTAGCSTTSGLMLFGGYREDGIWSTLYETHGGGEGARIDRDGVCAMRPHISNVMNTPAEIIEIEYPITIECQKLRKGSGGKGKHRGGEGQHREYRMRVDDVTLTTMFERAIIPPYGLQGGEDGATFRVTLEKANGESFNLPGKINIRLQKDDLVIMESSGGGGYGTP